MRKSRFTDAQLIWMIKEQEAGLPTPAASWPCGDTTTPDQATLIAGEPPPPPPRRSALDA